MEVQVEDVQKTEFEGKYNQELVRLFIKHFNRSFPEVLWHYTSVASLREILKSNQFWFSPVSALEDNMEVLYARDLTDAVLQAYLDKGDNDDRSQILLQTARARLIKSNADSVWHTASFTEVDDDIAQWDRFGDSKRGISIGFDGKELIKFFSRSPEDRPFITPVSYDGQNVVNFISEMIENAIFNFRNDFDWVEDVQLSANTFLNLLSVDVFSIIPKHPSFQSEREWRFARPLQTEKEHKELIHINNGYRWPVGRGEHSDSNSELLPIKKIRLGPHYDELKSIERALTAANFPNVEILKSNLSLK